MEIQGRSVSICTDCTMNDLSSVEAAGDLYMCVDWTVTKSETRDLSSVELLKLWGSSDF